MEEVFFNFLCSFSDSEECLGPVKHLWWCFLVNSFTGNRR